MDKYETLKELTVRGASNLLATKLRGFIFAQMSDLFRAEFHDVIEANKGFIQRTQEDWDKVLSVWGSLKDPQRRYDFSISVLSGLEKAIDNTVELGGEELLPMVAKFRDNFCIEDLMPAQDIRTEMCN